MSLHPKLANHFCVLMFWMPGQQRRHLGSYTESDGLGYLRAVKYANFTQIGLPSSLPGARWDCCCKDPSPVHSRGGSTTQEQFACGCSFGDAFCAVLCCSALDQCLHIALQLLGENDCVDSLLYLDGIMLLVPLAGMDTGVRSLLSFS